MRDIKKCLTIGDSNWFAGIQSDLKVFTELGVYGTGVITSIGNYDIPIDVIEWQIKTIFESSPVNAVKLGKIRNAETIAVVAKNLCKYNIPFVLCDPIISKGCEGAIIKYLFPIADIITPNIIEAEEFLGGYIEDVLNMKEAARILHEYGAKAVLITGGELDGDTITDVLFSEESYTEFSVPRTNCPNVHGKSNMLTAAIVAYSSLGESLENAIKLARERVSDYIKSEIQ